MFWNLVSAISTNAVPGYVIFWHLLPVFVVVEFIATVSAKFVCNAEFTKSQISYEVTLQYTDFYSLFHSIRLQIQRDIIRQIFSTGEKKIRSANPETPKDWLLISM